MLGHNRSLVCPGPYSWPSSGRGASGSKANSSGSSSGKSNKALSHGNGTSNESGSHRPEAWARRLNLGWELNDLYVGPSGGTPCVKDETCVCVEPTHIRELVNVTIDGIGCYACEPKRPPACTEAQDQCTPEACECADPSTHVKHSATTVDGTPCHFCEPVNGIRAGLGMSEFMIAVMVTSVVLMFHFLSKKPATSTNRNGNLRLARRRGDQSRAIRVQQEALSWYEEVLITIADMFDALGEGVCDIASGIWYLISSGVSMFCSGAVELLCMIENGAHGVSGWARQGAHASGNAAANLICCGRRGDSSGDTGAAKKKAKKKEVVTSAPTPVAPTQQNPQVATASSAKKAATEASAKVATASSAKKAAPEASAKVDTSAAKAAPKKVPAANTAKAPPSNSKPAAPKAAPVTEAVKNPASKPTAALSTQAAPQAIGTSASSASHNAPGSANRSTSAVAANASGKTQAGVASDSASSQGQGTLEIDGVVDTKQAAKATPTKKRAGKASQAAEKSATTKRAGRASQAAVTPSTGKAPEAATSDVAERTTADAHGKAVKVKGDTSQQQEPEHEQAAAANRREAVSKSLESKAGSGPAGGQLTEAVGSSAASLSQNAAASANRSTAAVDADVPAKTQAVAGSASASSQGQCTRDIDGVVDAKQDAKASPTRRRAGRTSQPAATSPTTKRAGRAAQATETPSTMKRACGALEAATSDVAENGTADAQCTAVKVKDDSSQQQESDNEQAAKAQRREALLSSWDSGADVGNAGGQLIVVNTFLAEPVPEVILRRTKSESDMASLL